MTSLSSCIQMYCTLVKVNIVLTYETESVIPIYSTVKMHYIPIIKLNL